MLQNIYRNFIFNSSKWNSDSTLKWTQNYRWYVVKGDYDVPN